MRRDDAYAARRITMRAYASVRRACVERGGARENHAGALFRAEIMGPGDGGRGGTRRALTFAASRARALEPPAASRAKRSRPRDSAVAEGPFDPPRETDHANPRRLRVDVFLPAGNAHDSGAEHPSLARRRRGRARSRVHRSAVPHGG